MPSGLHLADPAPLFALYSDFLYAIIKTRRTVFLKAEWRGRLEAAGSAI
jgi:hypothetical protein